MIGNHSESSSQSSNDNSESAEYNPEILEAPEFNWEFIGEFAKEWVKHLCPVFKCPINYPVAVDIRKGNSIETVPVFYEQVALYKRHTLPDTDYPIVRLRPFYDKNRDEVLAEFFAPMLYACKHDDPNTLLLWLAHTNIHSPLTTIHYPIHTVTDTHERFQSSSLITVLYEHDVPNILEAFLQFSLDPDLKFDPNSDHQNLLEAFVANNHINSVKVLLDAGADIIDNDIYEQLMSAAIFNANYDMIALLLKRRPIPSHFPEVWHEPVANLYAAADYNATRCSELLAKYGVMSLTMSTAQYGQCTLLDIAAYELDLQKFVWLLSLGINPHSMLNQPFNIFTQSVLDRKVKNIDEAGSIPIFYDYPELIKAFLNDDVEVFKAWHQSESFHPGLRIPIGECLKDELGDQYEALAKSLLSDEIQSVGLLTQTLINDNTKILAYMINHFTPGQIRRQFEDDIIGPHLMVVEADDIDNIKQIMLMLSEIYKAPEDADRLNQLLYDMLTRALEFDYYDTFKEMVEFIDTKLKGISIKPHSKIFNSFVGFDFNIMEDMDLGWEIFDLLDKPVIAACKQHWLQLAQGYTYALAISRDRFDVIEFFLDQPWFDEYQVLIPKTNQVTTALGCHLESMSVEMFSYLLSRGHDLVADIKNDQLERTNPLKELIRLGRADLLAFLLEHDDYNLSSPQFNKEEDKPDIQPNVSNRAITERISALSKKLPNAVHYACNSINQGCLALLFDHGMVPFKDDFERKFMFILVLGGKHPELYEYLANQLEPNKTSFGLKDDTTPLLWLAVHSGVPVEVIDSMLDRGIPADACSKMGKHMLASPVLLAAMILIDLVKDSVKVNDITEHAVPAERAVLAVESILKRGPYDSEQLHKALLGLVYIGVHPYAQTMKTAIINHINKHKLKLEDKFVFKGFKPPLTVDDWKAIKDQLWCFQKEPVFKTPAIPNRSTKQSAPKALGKSKPKAQRAIKHPKVINLSAHFNEYHLEIDGLKAELTKHQKLLQPQQTNDFVAAIEDLKTRLKQTTTQEKQLLQEIIGQSTVVRPEHQAEYDQFIALLNETTAQWQDEIQQVAVAIYDKLDSARAEFDRLEQAQNEVLAKLEKLSLRTGVLESEQAKLKTLQDHTGERCAQISQTLLAMKAKEATLSKAKFAADYSNKKALAHLEATFVTLKQALSKIDRDDAANLNEVLVGLDNLNFEIKELEAKQDKIKWLQDETAKCCQEISSTFSAIKETEAVLRIANLEVVYGNCTPLAALEASYSSLLKQLPRVDKKAVVSIKELDQLNYQLSQLQSLHANAKASLRALHIDVNRYRLQLIAKINDAVLQAEQVKIAVRTISNDFKAQHPDAKDKFTQNHKRTANAIMGNLKLSAKRIWDVQRLAEVANGQVLCGLVRDSQTHLELVLLCEQNWTKLFNELSLLWPQMPKIPEAPAAPTYAPDRIAPAPQPICFSAAIQTGSESMKTKQWQTDMLVRSEIPIKRLGARFKLMSQLYLKGSFGIQWIENEVKSMLHSPIQLSLLEGYSRLDEIKQCLTYYPYAHDKDYHDYLCHLAESLATLADFSARCPMNLNRLPLPPRISSEDEAKQLFELNKNITFLNAFENLKGLCKDLHMQAHLVYPFPIAILEALYEFIEIARLMPEQTKMLEPSSLDMIANAIYIQKGVNGPLEYSQTDLELSWIELTGSLENAIHKIKL